jgi:hypothetical protein
MNARILSSGKWLGIAVICLFQFACSPNDLYSNNTELKELYLESFYLDQVFQSTQTDYSTSVGYLASSIRIFTAPEDSSTSVSINGIDASPDGTRIALNEGSNTINIIVTAGNGDQQTYTLTATRATFADFSRQAYAKSFNTGAGDAFGFSVATTQDLMVAGAFNEDSNTTGINSLSNDDGNADNSGAVYVYLNYGGVWIPDAYVKASNTGANDQFGYQVALSGSTLVVSAHLEDSNSSGINSTPNDAGNNVGAVYVFVRGDDGYWTQQAYIKPSNPSDNDEFGRYIDIDGDTLVVGSRYEDSNTTGINSTPNDSGINSGAVYVFTRDDNNQWSQQAFIKASNAGDNDGFSVVSLSGDTLAVGAIYENSTTTGINSMPNDSGSGNGAAYVFTREGITWTQQAYIKPDISQDSLAFGIVDVDEDTLVVGAIGDNSESYGINSTYNNTGAADFSGSAFVFVRNGTNWSQQAYLKAPLTGTLNDLEYFGFSVDIDGNTLIVGSPLEKSSVGGTNPATSDDTLSSAGAAFVYTRAGTNWQQTLHLKADTPESDDLFGIDVAIAGDIIITGIPGEDSNSYGVNDIYNDDGSVDDSGAAYLYQ